ncbi:MAG: hypothetical protein AAF725_15190 [Acidobacteriota bacterium]
MRDILVLTLSLVGLAIWVEVSHAHPRELPLAAGDGALLVRALMAGTVPTAWFTGLAVLLAVVLAASARAHLGGERRRELSSRPDPDARAPGAWLPPQPAASCEMPGHILDALENAEQNLSQIRTWLEDADPPARQAGPPASAPPPEKPEAAPSANEVFLQRVHAVIARRLGDESFSVHGLAREVGVDRSHLYRRLSTLIDQSPSGLIRTRRLEHAAQPDALICLVDVDGVIRGRIRR